MYCYFCGGFVIWVRGPLSEKVLLLKAGLCLMKDILSTVAALSLGSLEMYRCEM